MLHVHHDVEVVEQHPPVLTFALTVRGFGAVGREPLLDGFDDGTHLSLVRGRAEDKGIGDRQLITHIERDGVYRKFVGRRGSGITYEINGLRTGGHTTPRKTGAIDFNNSLSRLEVFTQDHDDVG